MKDIVLNLLVFDNKVKQGAIQKVLIEEGIKLGFKRFEIRREYFKNIEEEAIEIKQLSEQFGLELFYSVPEEVFVEGKINPYLEDYLTEAKNLNVTHIKWNIGDFEHYQGSLRELIPLTEKGIKINIENDQTQTSGKIKAIESFMKEIIENKVDIGYVYDLGNWRFVGEDELDAANKLKTYVKYIHVKDVTTNQGKLAATNLGKGDIDWQKVLSILPNNVPIAIEYPTETSEEILEAKKMLEGM